MWALSLGSTLFSLAVVSWVRADWRSFFFLAQQSLHWAVGSFLCYIIRYGVELIFKQQPLIRGRGVSYCKNLLSPRFEHSECIFFPPSVSNSISSSQFCSLYKLKWRTFLLYSQWRWIWRNSWQNILCVSSSWAMFSAPTSWIACSWCPKIAINNEEGWKHAACSST